MTDYKMLCLDIDGTLLNSRHEISGKTAQAIQNIAEEIPVILVSARMPAGILPFKKELGIEAPIISYSGALVLDSSQNILMNKTIPVREIPVVYSLTDDKIHLSLYSGDRWFIEENDYWARQEAEITGLTPLKIDYQSIFSNEAGDKNKKMEDLPAVNKILCMAEEEVIDNLYRQLIGIKTDLGFYRSKPTYLEIMHKDVSKAEAIDLLASRNGINRSEIIAVGDNYNDIAMLEYAGLGVAMGNAPVEVKELADEETASNDQDGVARLIDKYFG